MTDIDLKEYRRVYLTLADNKDGRVKLRATFARPPHGAYMVALMSAGMMATPAIDVLLISDPTKNPALRGLPGKDGLDGTNGTNGKNGAPGSLVIRTVDVVDRALVAIAIGLRTITVSCLGISPGQAVQALPVAALPGGYAVHNAWVTKKDEIAIRITGPALAVGASNTLSLAIASIG